MVPPNHWQSLITILWYLILSFLMSEQLTRNRRFVNALAKGLALSIQHRMLVQCLAYIRHHASIKEELLLLKVTYTRTHTHIQT